MNTFITPLLATRPSILPTGMEGKETKHGFRLFSRINRGASVTYPATSDVKSFIVGVGNDAPFTVNGEQAKESKAGEWTWTALVPAIPYPEPLPEYLIAAGDSEFHLSFLPIPDKEGDNVTVVTFLS